MEEQLGNAAPITGDESNKIKDSFDRILGKTRLTTQLLNQRKTRLQPDLGSCSSTLTFGSTANPDCSPISKKITSSPSTLKRAYTREIRNLPIQNTGSNVLKFKSSNNRIESVQSSNEPIGKRALVNEDDQIDQNIRAPVRTQLHEQHTEITPNKAYTVPQKQGNKEALKTINTTSLCEANLMQTHSSQNVALPSFDTSFINSIIPLPPIVQPITLETTYQPYEQMFMHDSNTNPELNSAKWPYVKDFILTGQNLVEFIRVGENDETISIPAGYLYNLSPKNNFPSTLPTLPSEQIKGFLRQTPDDFILLQLDQPFTAVEGEVLVDHYNIYVKLNFLHDYKISNTRLVPIVYNMSMEQICGTLNYHAAKIIFPPEFYKNLKNFALLQQEHSYPISLLTPQGRLFYLRFGKHLSETFVYAHFTALSFEKADVYLFIAHVSLSETTIVPNVSTVVLHRMKNLTRNIQIASFKNGSVGRIFDNFRFEHTRTKIFPKDFNINIISHLISQPIYTTPLEFSQYFNPTNQQLLRGKPFPQTFSAQNGRRGRDTLYQSPLLPYQYLIVREFERRLNDISTSLLLNVLQYRPEGICCRLVDSYYTEVLNNQNLAIQQHRNNISEYEITGLKNYR
jgi:hypothetical protein